MVDISSFRCTLDVASRGVPSEVPGCSPSPAVACETAFGCGASETAAVGAGAVVCAPSDIFETIWTPIMSSSSTTYQSLGMEWLNGK